MGLSYIFTHGQFLTTKAGNYYHIAPQVIVGNATSRAISGAATS